ncbi:hypothetical protein NE237_011533 [Protea cynaroides]|uniref:Uncharacterized protein n=1 Tax=Protea cynaroides TaxID=273540 RepID=A0A9Q0GWB1_9MAGN|nr:hypothetical protein NE237_011533 [Protea cynaroides]
MKVKHKRNRVESEESYLCTIKILLLETSSVAGKSLAVKLLGPAPAKKKPAPSSAKATAPTKSKQKLLKPKAGKVVSSSTPSSSLFHVDEIESFLKQFSVCVLMETADLGLFDQLHVLSHSTDEGKKNTGWYYFSHRPSIGKPIAINKLSKVPSWKERFFFISSANDRYLLSLTNRWRMVSTKALNRPPVLSDVKIDTLRLLKGGVLVSAQGIKDSKNL